jgi:beta-glucanase (GH16 family)
MINFYKILGTVAILMLINGCTDKKVIPVVTPTAPVADLGWTFESTPFWQDDFNTNGIPDPAKWSYDVGGSGWGNNELQYYTSGENAGVVNGNLVIQAKKENYQGRQYTSTRLISKGKGDFQYGRFEIRAKLPKGRGTWPALWMLSSDNSYGIWPASGEIDIMEHVGFDLNKVHCSVHCSAYNHSRGNQKSSTKTITDGTTDFHLYRVDWTPYSIKGFVDDEQYFEFINENNGFSSWPFNKKFYMIMNVAIGGNWGGAQGVDDNIFPTAMEVDYVKVYKIIEQ